MNKNNYLRYWWVIPVAIFLSQTCFYHKMTHLSEDDLTWVNAYQIGDTCYYESNLGDYDIMVIKNIQVNNSINPFNSGSSMVSSDYEASARMVMDFITRFKYDNSFFIRKDVDSNRLIISACVFDLSSEDLFPTPGRAMVGTECFYDCIVLDENNSHLRYHRREKTVKSFVWSKSKGLVQYTFNDGETFILKKHNQQEL